MLEIEEEEEIEKMRLFKRDYVRRKVKKYDDDWKEIIEAEMDKVDEKERVLSELSYAQIRKEQLLIKLVSHQMATSYLENLLDKSVENLYIRGKYQMDEEINQMDNYMEWMYEEVMTCLKEDQQVTQQVKKFYPETVPNLLKIRKPYDEIAKKKRRKFERYFYYPKNY